MIGSLRSFRLSFFNFPWHRNPITFKNFGVISNHAFLVKRPIRARYLDIGSGRFWTMDTFEGNNEDPLSLHKYLYAANNPVDNMDPLGTTIFDALDGQLVHKRLGLDFTEYGENPDRLSDRWISTILSQEYKNQYFPIIPLRPDLIDTGVHQIFEIKPLTSFPEGVIQLNSYLEVLNHFDTINHWTAGTSVTYSPPSEINLGMGAYAKIWQPEDGVITYEVLDLPELVAVSAGVVVTMTQADAVATWSIATLDTLLAF